MRTLLFLLFVFTINWSAALMVANVLKLNGVIPDQAFNVSIYTIIAHSLVSIYLLVHWIIGGRK